MSELLWVVKIGFCIWIAWKAVLMLNVGNPLVAIMVAVICMFGGPIALNALVDTFAGEFSHWGLTDVLATVQIGAPMAFALLGALLWSGLETVVGR